MTDSESPPVPAREPFFNAPLPVFILPAVLIGLYTLQSGLGLIGGPDAENDLINSFALNPLLLRQGQVGLLITHQFLHGSWMHVLMNSVFCVAFAAPVVRACGKGIGGAVSYFAFFLFCGVIAGLGYCALHWHSGEPVIGASGAISGLLGASMRLGNVRAPGTLNPLLNAQVITMSLVWCVGYPLLNGFLSSVAGAGIAWEAHVAGYICGLFLIEPWLHVFRSGYFTTK